MLWWLGLRYDVEYEFFRFENEPNLWKMRLCTLPLESAKYVVYQVLVGKMDQPVYRRQILKFP